MPPGHHAKTITLCTGPTSGLTIPVRSRGAGTYILVCDHEVHNLVMNGKTIGGIGSSGRPTWNTIVWHKHSNADSSPSNISFRAGRPGQTIKLELWLARPGTPLPRAPGWQPSDSRRHGHG